MASPFPERGIIADTYLHRPSARARPKRMKRIAILGAVVGFVGVFLCQLVSGVPSVDSASSQETAAPPPNDSYEFAAYTLNHTVRTETGACTNFAFDSSQLPFDFHELLFGEFRGDTEYSSRYYAGMSLLARAEGPNSSMRFLESAGKAIEQILYAGQSLIVLNGWESISKDAQGKVLDHRWGSMQIAAYDWRDGSWCPDEGIAVEHPLDVTVSSVSLCVMVYEPSKSTDIPEFGPAFVCLCLAVLVILVRRRGS